ncbi:MAG: CPBP family intramembrane glutamic endopeptidase [Halanaerobiales bacterium]
MYIDGISIGIINMFLFSIVVLARKLISNEGLEEFLIIKKELKWNLFWEGSLMGFLLILGYVFLTIIFRVGNLNFTFKMRGDFLVTFLSFIFGFAAVALFEESLFRDYLLLKLKKRFTTIKAVFFSSLIFSLVHIFSYISTGPLTVIALFNAYIIGIILALIVVKTESIMWALGFHFLWNLTQTVFLTVESSIFSLELNRGFLAGTPYIPEAGILVTIILVILSLYMVDRFTETNIIPRRIGNG